jgi:hypothetical protein
MPAHEALGKHHARLSAVQRRASESPCICLLSVSLSQITIQAASALFLPVVSLDHRPFHAGTDGRACDSVDRRRSNRRRGSRRVARTLCRTTKPSPRPTKVLGRPFLSDWVFHRLPLAENVPDSVIENQAVGSTRMFMPATFSPLI